MAQKQTILLRLCEKSWFSCQFSFWRVLSEAKKPTISVIQQFADTFAIQQSSISLQYGGGFAILTVEANDAGIGIGVTFALNFLVLSPSI